MKNLNNVQFLEKINLSNREFILENYNITLNEQIQLDSSQKSYIFKNCNFQGSRIEFYSSLKDINNEYNSFISFERCKIENNLFILKNQLSSLTLSQVTIASKQFYISTSNIKNIRITGIPEKPNEIHNLVIQDLQLSETSLDFRLNQIETVLLIDDSLFSDIILNKNTIFQIQIFNSTISKSFEYWQNKIIADSFFSDNNFSHFIATETYFGSNNQFKNNNYYGNINFEKIKNENAILNFEKCNFEKYVYFDGAKISKFSFDSSFFKEIVSFQEVECNTIHFNRTHFDKVVFFNELKINKINECNLKTIRVIKNQLLKTENKTDYLKYSSIEYNYILNNDNLSINDKLLLILNKTSNNFGISWIRGVGFTVIVSIFFFIVLLTSNSFVKSSYPLNINPNNDFVPLSTILVEYLKFVLSLGFNNEEIQSNGYLYLIFIIAKILIGYGLFQTISAFRKYGKN